MKLNLLAIILAIATIECCSVINGYVSPSLQQRYDAAKYVVSGTVESYATSDSGLNDTLWLGNLTYYKECPEFDIPLNDTVLVEGFTGSAACGVDLPTLGSFITIFATDSETFDYFKLHYIGVWDAAVDGPLTLPLQSLECTCRFKYAVIATLRPNDTNILEMTAQTALDDAAEIAQNLSIRFMDPIPNDSQSDGNISIIATVTNNFHECNGTVTISSSNGERTWDFLLPNETVVTFSFNETDIFNFYNFINNGTGQNTIQIVSNCHFEFTSLVIRLRYINNNCTTTPSTTSMATLTQPTTQTTQQTQTTQTTQPTQSSQETQSSTGTMTTCHNMGSCNQDTYPTASALSESQLNSSCVFGTYLFDGYCACWSGAYGKDCTMGSNAVCGNVVAKFWNLQPDEQQNCYPFGELDITNNNRDFCMDFTGHSSCSSQSSWGTVSPLSTSSPPQMDSANFASDNLTIVVSQPMVNGRADGAAYLNDNKLNKTSPFCTYPISDFIFKEVDGCRDVWRFNIPWNLAVECGWDILYQEGYKVYKGQVIIHNHEYLSNIHDCRFIQSVLRIQIRFQVYVSINMSSVVYNQPNVQSAITQQIVAIQLGEAACIQLTTIINYPYELSNGALVLTPPGKVESETFSSVYQSCSGQSQCTQRWRSCLTLTNNTCDLNGAYRMNFTKECRSSDISCPLSASDKPTTIDFNLASENFCAEISIDIGLYGSIQVYEDSTFTVLKSAFILGTKACFLVTVNSDSNPSPYNASTASIKLLSTQLYTVTVRVGDNSIIKLWDSGAVLSNNYNTQISQISLSDGNKVGFCYFFSAELILNLNCTGSVEVITGAQVQVNYNDGSSVKRQTSNGSDKTTLSASNNLDTTTTQQSKNFGNVIYASVFLILITLFF